MPLGLFHCLVEFIHLHRLKTAPQTQAYERSFGEIRE